MISYPDTGRGYMKTRPEYRKAALTFARNNGFDTVHFQGFLYGYEVYTGDYKVSVCVGLPQIILADENGAVFSENEDPFSILNSCRKNTN